MALIAADDVDSLNKVATLVDAILGAGHDSPETLSARITAGKFALHRVTYTVRRWYRWYPAVAAALWRTTTLTGVP